MDNFISIITVNYNGKKLIRSFLESITALDYPKNLYETIVVDNASTDGSVDYIKNNFPWVKLIESSINLGFGGGNNLGIQSAKGNLCLLVNSDTELTSKSLKNLLDVFKSGSHKIGAVSAKLVLIDYYIPITIEEAFFSKCDITTNAKSVNKDPYVISHDSGSIFKEKVFVPYNYTYSEDIEMTLFVKPYRKNDFSVFIGNKMVYRGHLKSVTNEFGIKIKISANEIKNIRKNLIQNSGNFYFRDGSGRDRGAVVIRHKQYYEEDNGQYDMRQEIPAFCGAGVLLNKRALNDVGYFDEQFFMYYEDADLSFRLREGGWKIIYDPHTVIRHIHAASSGEWSDFFVYNVERGRLLFISKHWPRIVAILQFIKYIGRDVVGSIILNRRPRVRFRVMASAFAPFLFGLFRKNRMSYKEFMKLI